MTAPKPETEEERLAALRECQVLDTPAEDAYDDIVRLVAHVCGVPIAAVSLVDSERQWFKSILGVDVCETSRDVSFCAHAILQPNLLIIPDACADERFADNALVTGEPHIRFYAGAPLVTADGHALGSLCVIDTVPRQLTSEQGSALRLLARQATHQLETARRLAAQERLMAEYAATEAERHRFAAIVESLEDSVTSLDLNGVITTWNQASERVLGLSAAQAIGRHISATVPAGDVVPLQRFHEILRRDEVIPPIDIKRPNVDGSERVLRLTISPIKDAAGELIGSSAIAHDVTEERRQQEIVQRSEARLAEAQRIARIGSWEYEISTGRIHWSDELFCLFGMDPAEGEPSVEELMRHYHPDDVAMHREVTDQAIRGGLPYEFDIRILQADGSVRWAHAVGRGERDAAGSVARLVGTLMDIHERKSIEESLRENTQFVESIADQSTSIIFVFDLDTLSNVYSNRNVAEFLGYSVEQVQAMGSDLLSAMLYPDDLPLIQSHFGQFADKADGEVVEIEYRAQHADGEWRWIWNRETVFKRHADGTPRQILGTAHDITARKQAQEESARLAAIVESSQDAILGATLDGMLVSWNDAAERIYGYSEAEVIGRHASVLAPPSESRFMASVTQAILRGERRDNLEVRRRRKDGAWVDISLTFSPIRNTAGEIVGIAAIGRDITVQKRAEEALHKSEEALHAIMEGAPIVLYATDKDGIVTLSEGAGLERLGLAAGEMVGRSIFDLYPDHPEVAQNMHRALSGEVVSYDFDNQGLCYHNEVRPQRDAQGVITGLTGVAHDITERKQAEESLKDFAVVLEFQKQELEKANAELEALATLDGLTGLRNRRAFDERLTAEFERASRYHTPLSLLMLDIDFFKQYNDSFGHPAGDEVLRAMGRVLQKATRETDFLARYGGEEIAVILPETDGDGALQVAERIRIAVATAQWAHRDVTASIGVCTLRLGMDSPEELLSCADRALYQSKAKGRNRVTHGFDLSASNKDFAVTGI